MQIHTDNTQYQQIIQGCLVFLKAFDTQLYSMCIQAIEELGVTDKAFIVVDGSSVYLPEALFANVVTEHIIYQLLVALRSRGVVAQSEIDQFVRSTRVTPYVWDLELGQ
ncbi:MAG: hypothetical protein ACKKL4_02355 [Patescibacteria group bacterium]